MNLLFLTPQLPHPPQQGTAIRNWGLIKSLAARHTVSLLTFAQDAEPISGQLRAACKRIETVPPPRRSLAARLRDLSFSALPDLAHRLASPQFALRLSALAASESFDAIFVEGLELALFTLTLSSEQTKIIYDAHNAETVLQRRAFRTDRRSPRRWPAALYSLVQSRRLARFEREACRRADAVLCVSPQDAEALRRLDSSISPAIVPNGIFLADYSPPPASFGSQRIVFTGKMDYRPNVDAARWFAEEILPAAQREAPQAEFVIVGQKPAAAVLQLRSRRGITVTGAVDDARPYIAGAALYVAPLRMGGGTRFKLLEAMALRCPIVSTTLGAEGFPVQHGREMLLADTPEDFVQAVTALLRDERRRAALAEAAHQFVRRYDWGEIIPVVEGVLSGVARSGRAHNARLL